MKKQTGLFLLLVCSHLMLYAQAPTERIYVQTDRDYYIPGETISFTGFVLADDDSVRSRNLFVELWDDSLRQLASITVPLMEGAGTASINIPKGSRSSIFFLRAYSDVSMRQVQTGQYIRTLTRSAADHPVPPDQMDNMPPVFYPEGGKLVNQARNHIAYKAGAACTGSIRNNKGETLATLNPVFNGMGSFTLTPVKGETYTCYWEEKGRTGITPLPQAVDYGIALHVQQTPDTLYLDLDNAGNPDPLVQQLKIHLMIGNEPAYVVEMNLANRSSFRYFIPLHDYRAGLAELRVVGSDQSLLASRPLFINRHSLSGLPDIELIKKDLSSRGGNKLKLQFKDSTIRLLSVSVTDGAYSTGNNGSGLAASFLMPGDRPVPAAFRGIRNPEQMDLAVQVAAWPLPVSAGLQKRDSLPMGDYLRLEGTVLKGRRPLAEKNLLVGVRSASAGKQLFKVKTDEKGKFSIDGLILFGDVYVHCRIPKDELQELNCKFRLVAPVNDQPCDLFSSFEAMAKKTITHYNQVVKAVQSGPMKGEAEDTLAFADKAITLSEVILTASSSAQAWKRMRELDEKYIAGSAFSGYYASSETLDVLNDPEQVRYFDLFKYMRANFKRVDVRYVNGAPQLFYFGRGATGEMMVTLYYIDNSIVDRNQLDFISLDQVAAIKFVQNLAIGRELPPAVAVFLKKKGDTGYWEKDRFQVFEKRVNGYPLTQEFKEPDYRKEETIVDNDLRKTISWKPRIQLENGTAEIQFYNNDRAKKIRIIAEGIAADGSIIYVEKEIE